MVYCKGVEHGRSIYLQLCIQNAEDNSYRAKCASELGNFCYGYAETMEQSIKFFNLAHYLEPENHEYIHNLSRAYYFVEDFEKAGIYLRLCINTTLPNLERSLCAAKLSSILYKKGELEESDYFMNLAAEIDDNNPRYYLYLSESYIRQQNYIKASESINKCLSSNNQERESEEFRQQCNSVLDDVHKKNFLSESNLIKALSYYQNSNHKSSENLTSIHKLAFMLIHEHRYPEAVPFLEICVEAIDGSFSNKLRAECANYLANFYFVTSKDKSVIEKGIEYSKLAYTLNPTEQVYLYNLAHAYYKFDFDYQETIKMLKKCVNAERSKNFGNLEKARCANNVGSLYFSGKLEPNSEWEIIKYFRLAIKLNPDNPSYHYNLAMTYYYTGKHEAIPIIIDCKNNYNKFYSETMQAECQEKYLDILGAYISEYLLS